MSFTIGPHSIRPLGRCFIIGEVAQAHDGSLGTAHAYIDAVARAGADAVKFQTHIADAESTSAEPFRLAFSRQDATRIDYWRRMEFSEEQWRGLAEHARQSGLVFLSSPFSVAAVELLDRLGMPAWKVPSGELDHDPLIERVLATRKPVLLSTGMSTLAEVDAAVEHVRAAGCPLLVFQATTAYPCPPEKLGIALIARLRTRYQCPVGLSDHSGTMYPGLGAVLTGLDALEVHVTFSRETFGPDVQASVTTDDLRSIVDGVRFLERARDANPEKDALAADVAGLRQMFGRSVVAAQDLAAGTVLDGTHLVAKKPAGGLPPAKLRELVGRRLRRDVQRDELLLERDIE